MSPNVLCRFRGKTWYLFVFALVFSGLGAVGLILGPLYWLGILQRANGQPGDGAGMALTLMSIPLLWIAWMGWWQVWMRREPLIALYREGIAFRFTGKTQCVPSIWIPSLLQVLWLAVSGRGFRHDTVWLDWQELGEIVITGQGRNRKLVVLVISKNRDSMDLARETGTNACHRVLAFESFELRDSLESIAAELHRYQHDSAERNYLLSRTSDGQ